MTLSKFEKEDQALKESVIARIEIAREAAEMSFELAGSKMKPPMKRQQWDRIVKGRSGTKWPTLIKMMRAVQLNPDKVFDDVKRAAAIESFPETETSQKAALIVETLSPEVTVHAMATLQAFQLLSASSKNGESGRKRSPHVEPKPPEGEVKDLTRENLNGEVKLKEETKEGEQTSKKQGGKKR